MSATKIGAIVVIAIFAVIFVVTLGALPDVSDRIQASETASRVLEDGRKDTGARNLVSAVLFDYRGFDTLGEATVIFAAVAGVALAFSHEVLLLSKTGLSPLAKESMNILTPFIMVLGFYIIFHGHISPGGGFQGGVVLASWAILACLVYGVEVEEMVISTFAKMVVESIGIISFVLVAGIGVLRGVQFLSNLSAGYSAGMVGSIFSAGNIPYLNTAIGIKVGVGLAVLFVTMAKRDVGS